MASQNEALNQVKYHAAAPFFVPTLEKPQYEPNHDIDLIESRQQVDLLFPEKYVHHTSVKAVAIASSIESFYRSAMNAKINQIVYGKPLGKLFPDMHIQTPTRVVYIVGIKHIRTMLQDIDYQKYQYPIATRLGFACLPGIIMCPFSSILEASNVGTLNPEPIYSRWRRGFAPRIVREVIFALGINQLSDYFAEKSKVENKQLRNAVGSIYGGIICAYFSHVPHNLSAMRLANPTKSYSQLWVEYYSKYLSKIPVNFPHRNLSAQFMSIGMPLGCLTRMTQITGSFCIINGSINAMKDMF